MGALERSRDVHVKDRRGTKEYPEVVAETPDEMKYRCTVLSVQQPGKLKHLSRLLC